jgi:hypothetical protein
MQQATLAIKAINPHIVLVNYSDITSLANPTPGPPGVNPGGPYAAAWAEVDSFKWWLYLHGGTGTEVAALIAGNDQINTTQFTPPNNAGVNYPAWRANFDTIYSTMTALSLDGIYADKTTLIPPVDGDWDRDGDTVPLTDPPDLRTDGDVGDWWRKGFVAYFNAVRGGMAAGKMLFANCGDWSSQLDLAQFDFNYAVNGGVIESIIGQSYSPETTGGFGSLIYAYQNIMDITAAPQMQVFAHDGSVTDYQDFRYGLTSCLLGGGYYYHSDGAGIGGYHNVNWFDEFDNNLGAASTFAFPGPWQNGVYRRDFQNGIALVNPKGNGAQTVTLETGYKKITGSQDPGVNDGSTVTSVSLADRDGLILMRLP